MTLYVVLVGLLVASAVWASAGGAFIYWTGNLNNTIERANLDGSGVTPLIQGAAAPHGIAVNGTYIFWANSGDGDIGRASIDGSAPNQHFITGGDTVNGIAVEGQYVYWANEGNGLRSIGRAKLDGTEVNQRFITLPEKANPYGVAVDTNYLYVTLPYYEVCEGFVCGRTIARIGLDGKNANLTFITKTGFTGGIAVNGESIFWSDSSSQEINRVNLDGSSNNGSFQHALSAQGAGGIALDSNYIYWAASSPYGGCCALSNIGRATLQDYNAGTLINDSFGEPWGIAVDALTSKTGPGPGPGPGPTVSPAVTNVRQSRSTWREGSQLATFAKKARPPVGTTFSFTLNEQANVSLTFTQQVSGRKVGSKCVAQARKNRRRRSCKRTLTHGIISFTGHSGVNKVTFQGRVSSTGKLPLGRYTLYVAATNAAGQKSQRQSLVFTIVK
ncbi:MAG TPA: hypothetical protein VIG42_06800 [Solirubrobacteraceae bacterium]|jgi:hypothetical protein